MGIEQQRSTFAVRKAGQQSHDSTSVDAVLGAGAKFAEGSPMNRRALVTLTLLLPLSSCVDLADDPEEEVDSSADAITAVTLNDAALELSGKVVGRLIDGTADPASGGLTTRFDAKEASALFDLLVADVAGSRSEPVDLVMTGYDADGALLKIAVTEARPTGVTMVAALTPAATIRLELEVVWAAAEVQSGPAQALPSVPPAMPLTVGWELSDVPMGGLASITVGAQQAKGWQKAHFVPIGVPGGMAPPPTSKAALTLTTTDAASGHSHELSISGSWGEITWTDSAPQAWTSHVVGDSQGLTAR